MSDYIFLSGQEVEEVEEVEVLEEVLSSPLCPHLVLKVRRFFSLQKCLLLVFGSSLHFLSPSSTLGAKSVSPLDPQWIKALPAAF